MEDFLALLRERGQLLPAPPVAPRPPEHFETTEGTTILALRYRDGVLVAGDRRATMGNTVVYDRADKVLAIDDSAVLAISGSPAIGYEIARLLEVSFQHYRRSQLQTLSLDGKLRTLSRLLRENLGLAMQGIGAVVPILAAYDPQEGGKIFFYDLLGAQFETVDFTATGSGSPTIRGALYYQNRWGKRPLAEYDEAKAVALALKLLETAAEYDTATGGYRSRARIFPQVMRLAASGIALLPETQLEAHYQALGRDSG
ncbi:MAG: proteasome subunit alpha [Candidatus Handelsmanbacteria bacterium]|nr:proteasome subunit alpha [Candidatus Handelsmanbacteria bacterium]